MKVTVLEIGADPVECNIDGASLTVLIAQISRSPQFAFMLDGLPFWVKSWHSEFYTDGAGAMQAHVYLHVQRLKPHETVAAAETARTQ